MNTILPGRNRSTNTERLFSPAIWNDCPWKDIGDPRSGVDGVKFFDDFTTGGLITSPTTEAALVGTPYSGFGSSGATITYADLKGGAIVLTEVTDNEAVYLRSKIPLFQLSSALGQFWMEARVKIGAVSDDNIGFLFGLINDIAITVIQPLSTANPPIFENTNTNFVGFRAPEEDAGAVHTQYVANGVTAVTVESTVHTFVADTFVKLGMKKKKDGRLYFYVDNEEQGTSKLVPDATGTDFPADVRLCPIIGHRMGATASSGVTTMDWWAGAQLFD